MKKCKFFTALLLSVFFIGAFTIPLSAKQHHRHYHKSKSRSTSFGFNLNLTAPVGYTETHHHVATTPTYQQVTVLPQTAMMPQPYVQEYVYYPYQREQVIIRQQSYTPVYVQPQFGYSYYR